MISENESLKSADTSQQDKTLVRLVLIVCVIAIIPYVNILPNQFTYDDKGLFVENPSFARLNHVSHFLRHTYFDYSKEQSYRPIVTLTYLADYMLWGSQKPPWGYHLTNIVLNAAVAIVAFMLARALSGKIWIAFFAAIVFTLHPVHSEAIDSIGFREDLLVALFYLLALYFYRARYVSSKRTNTALSCICYAAALLSKEMALSFIAVLILHDLIMKRNAAQSWRAMLRRYVPYLMITAVYGIVRFWALRVESANPPRWVGESFWTNSLTMVSVIGAYVRLLIVPTPLQIEYNFPPVTHVGDVRLLSALCVLCVVIYLGFRFVRRAPLVAFAIFFFLITLTPVLNIVPLRYFIAERYLYLPSFGFALGIAYLITRIGNRRLELLLVSIVGVMLALIVVSRNTDWKNDRALWEKTVKQNPHSKKAHYGLGIYYYSNGMFDEAIREFEAALKSDPLYTPPRLYLGATYYVTKRYDDAIREYALVLRITPDDPRAYHNLGLAYRAKGIADQAIAAHEKAISLDPDNWSYHKDLAIAYLDKGEFDKARAELEKALRLNPQETRLRDVIRAVEERKRRGQP